MVTPGRAATKVCEGRAASRLFTPTPRQQSQDRHSKHSLLHRATTRLSFHSERLPLPPKPLLSFWCPGFGKRHSLPRDNNTSERKRSHLEAVPALGTANFARSSPPPDGAGVGSLLLAAPLTPSVSPSSPPATHIVILHAQGDIQHAHLHGLHQSLLHVEQRFCLHLPGDGGAAHPPLSLLSAAPLQRSRSSPGGETDRRSLSPRPILSAHLANSCLSYEVFISSLANQRSCTGSCAARV